MTDALGGVLTTFNNATSSAAVQGDQVYGPYGNRRSQQGSMATTKGYTGQFADAQTGLDYYNARYYDPRVGVFLSADTVQGNVQGMDPYSYGGDNPETKNDPSGRCPVDMDGQCHRPPPSGGGSNPPPPPGPGPCHGDNHPWCNPGGGSSGSGKPPQGKGGGNNSGTGQLQKDRQALDKHFDDNKTKASLLLEVLAVGIGATELLSLKGLVMGGLAAFFQAIVVLGQAIHTIADIMIYLNHGVISSTIKNLLVVGDALSIAGNLLNSVWVGMGWLASLGGAVVEATLSPQIATTIFGAMAALVVFQLITLGVQSYLDDQNIQESAVDHDLPPSQVHTECVAQVGIANC